MRSGVTSAAPSRCEVCGTGEHLALTSGCLQADQSLPESFNRLHNHVLCGTCDAALTDLQQGFEGSAIFPRCPDSISDADRVLLSLRRDAGQEGRG